MSLIWKKLTKYEEEEGNLGGTPSTRVVQSFSARVNETSIPYSTGGTPPFSYSTFSTNSNVIPIDCYFQAFKVTIDTDPTNANSYYRFEAISRQWFNTDTDGAQTNLIASMYIKAGATSADSRDLDVMYPKGIFIPKGSLLRINWFPSLLVAPAAFGSIEFSFDIRPVDPTKYIISQTSQTEGGISSEEFQIPFCNEANSSSDPNTNAYHYVPIKCTISDWHCYRTSSYVTTGTMRMRLRNTTTGNALSLDQTATSHTFSGGSADNYRIYSTTSSVSFSEGDIVRYSHEPVAGAPESRATVSAFSITPSVANEIPHFFSSTEVIPVGTTSYKSPIEIGLGTSTSSNDWSATATDRDLEWPYDETITNIRGVVSGIPGDDLTIRLKNLTTPDSIDLVFNQVDATAEDLTGTGSGELVIAKGDRVVLEAVAGAALGSRYIVTISCKGTIDTTADRVTQFNRVVVDSVVGAVSDTSFKVSAIIADNTRTNLVVANATASTKALFTEGNIVGRSTSVRPDQADFIRPDGTTNAKVYMAVYTITGLTANTQYHYAIERAGTIDYDSIRPIKTYYTEDADPPSSPVTDSYIFASCNEIDGQAARGTAQGGSSTTIQLASGETLGDDALNGTDILIYEGTGAGQLREVTDYVGATDTATITPAWSTIPDATSKYVKIQQLSEDLENPALLKAYETESNIRMFCHMGDFGYDNSISVTTQQSAFSKMLAQRLAMRSAHDYSKFLSRYNFIYTPSDHDGGYNDSNNETSGANLFMPPTYNVIRRLVPRYPYPTGSYSWIQGVPQTFKDGKITFIILDTQYQRHPSESPATMLGNGSTTTQAGSGSGNYTTWNQRDWILSTAIAAKAAGCKLLILVLGGAKIRPTGAIDTWQGDFLEEWKIICDALCDPDNDVPEIITVNGDTHNAGADDGLNSQIFDTSSGQMAAFRYSPQRRSQTEGLIGSDDWNGTPTGSTVPWNMGYGLLEITKDSSLHEYTYTFTAKDRDAATINVENSCTVSKDGTIKRLLDFAADKSNPVHPGIGGTVSVEMVKTWLGAARFNLSVADTAVIEKNTDYTVTEGDQNTHANASNPKINFSMLTTEPGTVTLTIDEATPADTGSTITQQTHILTIGELALTDPDDLEGLLHWYEADTGLTATTWTDQKGSADLSGAVTVISEGQNARDVADFDGTTDLMTTTLPAISLPYSVFVYVRFDNLNQPVNNNDFVLGFEESTGSNTTSALGRNRSNESPDGLNTTDINGSIRRNATAIPGQTYVMLGLKANSTGSLCEGIVNTTKDLTFANHAGGGDVDGTPVASNFRVGDKDNTVSNGLDGQVAGIAIYNRALEDIEINRLYNYFSARWDVISDPDSITGLLHLWDGDSGLTTDSGNVETWTDSKSSLVFSSSGFGTQRPTTTTTPNGHTVLDFARTSSQYMEVTVGTEVAIPYTVCAFIQFDQAAQLGQWNHILACRNAADTTTIFGLARNRSVPNNDDGQLVAVDRLGILRAADGLTYTALPGSQYMMASISVTGTSTVDHADGFTGIPGTGKESAIPFTRNTDYAGGAALPASGTLQLGANAGTAGYYMDGQIASVAIYDHEMSILELEQLYGYWYNRFIT